jgi:rare lipoprotein A
MIHKIIAAIMACIVALGANVATANTAKQFQRTEATWYGKAWDGRRTASGEIFSSRGFTVAHPTLPLGTVLEVRRAGGASSIFVRVNDRCRCTMDLAHAAADALGMVQAGRAAVEYSIANRVPVAVAEKPRASKQTKFVAAAEDKAPVVTETATALASTEGVDLGVVY